MTNKNINKFKRGAFVEIGGGGGCKGCRAIWLGVAHVDALDGSVKVMIFDAPCMKGARVKWSVCGCFQPPNVDDCFEIWSDE
jgi:hypothetical protein